METQLEIAPALHGVGFDIETGRLPDEIVLNRTKPYPEFKDPGPFNPADVKVGNIKDPAKIAAKIEEARAGYADKIEADRAKHAAESKAYYDKALAKAALNPLTGRVLCIGLREGDRVEVLECDDDEASLLRTFWQRYEVAESSGLIRFVGWNIFGFDLPFLIRRSVLNRVPVPRTVWDGRFFGRMFIDLAKEWACGVHGEFAALDDIATAVLGVGKDEGECNGESFGDFWFGGPALRAVAMQYHVTDLARTVELGAIIRPDVEFVNIPTRRLIAA